MKENIDEKLISVKQVNMLIDNLIQDIYPYLHCVDVDEVYDIIKKNKDKYIK